MAQIVIDIDDKTYKAFTELISINLGRSNKGIIGKCLNAIKHGKVLPKGHGRLIDADALEDTMLTREELINEDWATTESSVVSVILNTFAPTVIEADKEGQE